MSEKEWASFGFPPLRLTTSDLQALVQTAGPNAVLTADGESPIEASDFVPETQSWVAHAVIRTPEMKLEFSDDHASLNFDNRNATISEELAHSLCPSPHSGFSLLLPLLLGALIFVPLYLLGLRADVSSVAAMAAVLVGMALVAIRRRSSQPLTTQLEGEASKWCTTFPTRSIGFDDLGEILQLIGDDASVEFASDEKGPFVLVATEGIKLTLRETAGEVIYDDASSHMEGLYNQVLKHRQPLRWFTHDDLAIIAGMLFPIAAIVFAPDAMQGKAALIATVPWFAYLLWVLRNQSRKWTMIVRN